MKSKSINLYLAIQTFVLVLLILSGIVFYYSFSERENEKLEQEEKVKLEFSQAILNSIEHSAGLSLVTANFSNVYTQKDYYLFNIPGFQRKTIIDARVSATAGFNLDSIQIQVCVDDNKIEIVKMPVAKILHTAYNFNYLNMDQDLFADQISTEYLNTNQEKIKESLDNIVNSSDLVYSANREFIDRLEILNNIIKLTGWQVEIVDQDWEKNYYL